MFTSFVHLLLAGFEPPGSTLPGMAAKVTFGDEVNNQQLGSLRRCRVSIVVAPSLF